MVKSIFIKLLTSSIFIFILSTLICVSSSYALGDIFSQGKGFLEVGDDVSETINTGQLKRTSDFIYNTLLAIAIMVAVIVAMILGIQFMAASADEKAKVKEALMPFVVGCIVVFGAFTIWKVAVKMGNDAEDAIIASPVGSSGTSDGTTDTDSSVSHFQLGVGLIHCPFCGKALNGAKKCSSCGEPCYWTDSGAKNCGLCGSTNIIFINKALIISNAKHAFNYDVYCYDCGLWNNYSAANGKEYKLEDAIEAVKKHVKEQENNDIREPYTDDTNQGGSTGNSGTSTGNNYSGGSID